MPLHIAQKGSLRDPRTRHINEKAYMLVRLHSPDAEKPTVLTGFKLYPPRLEYKSTVKPPGTTFKMVTDGSPLYDRNGTMFKPTAGIRSVATEEWRSKNGIKVVTHSQERKVLEDDLGYWVGEDLKEIMKKDAGEVKLEWWKREDEGGRGAKCTFEDGTHVWWEVVDADIAYEDPAGVA